MNAEARQGDTLDAICWRELGRTESVVEQALELNPGLADLGAIIPAGTQVNLPELADLAPAERETVKLWDD